MSVRSVDEHLIHEWEAYFKLLDSHSLDFFVRRFFLVEELATGESYHLQTRLLVTFVQLDQLSVVAFGERSLGGDVGDQQALLALHEITKHVLAEVDVLDEERPKLASDLAIVSVLSLFP